jgi:hypothetical protein
MSVLTAYGGLLIRVGLYLLVFWPTVGYYVCSDSKKQDLSNPQLRGLLLGFLRLAGLLVRLSLVRRGD